jgi:hypothetical protein
MTQPPTYRPNPPAVQPVRPRRAQPVTGKWLTSKPFMALGAGVIGITLGAIVAGGSDATTTGPPTTTTVTATTRVVQTEPGPTATVRVTQKAKPAPRKTVTVTARPKGSESVKAAPHLDKRYATCRDAIAAGLGPYRRGVDPEYDWYQDRDGDGFVCES